MKALKEQMKRGILFDKDGTLIEINTVWEQATRELVKMFVPRDDQGDIHLENNILSDIGLDPRTGEIAVGGILAAGTIREIAEVFTKYFGGDLEQCNRKVSKFYYEYIKRNTDQLKPVAKLKELFKSITDAGVEIGVISSDDYDSTEFTLNYLDCMQYVSFIGTADIYLKKPNAQSIEAFMEKRKINKENITYVGDTINDMIFAKNAGRAISVLTGAGKLEELKPYSDAVYKDVSEFWEKEKSNFMQ